MNKDESLCATFKDLYPSYIDGMVEDETKIWMDRHIEECRSCSKWKNNYQGNIELSESRHSINVDTSAFEEDKKTMKKAKILIELGLSAVIMLAIWTSIWIFA